MVGLLRFRLEHGWNPVSASLLDNAIVQWRQTVALVDESASALERRRFLTFHKDMMATAPEDRTIHDAAAQSVGEPRKDDDTP